jgi:hypothetical protein
MRYNENRVEQTGFEAATEEELHLAFFRTANEMLIRWGHLQDQLGNVVVGAYGPECGSTQRLSGPLIKHPSGVYKICFNVLPSFRSCLYYILYDIKLYSSATICCYVRESKEWVN